MPHWNNQPWQRNLSKTASGKPGAVHTVQLSLPGIKDAKAAPDHRLALRSVPSAQALIRNFRQPHLKRMI
jgi:hypothetical protein